MLAFIVTAFIIISVISTLWILFWSLCKVAVTGDSPENLNILLWSDISLLLLRTFSILDEPGESQSSRKRYYVKRHRKALICP